MKPHLSLDIRKAPVAVEFYRKVFGVAMHKRTADMPCSTWLPRRHRLPPGLRRGREYPPRIRNRVVQECVETWDYGDAGFRRRPLPGCLSGASRVCRFADNRSVFPGRNVLSDKLMGKLAHGAVWGSPLQCPESQTGHRAIIPHQVSLAPIAPLDQTFNDPLLARDELKRLHEQASTRGTRF